MGIYKLQLKDDDSIEPIYFMLMKSVFDTKTIADHQKMMFFDLKGSTQGRRTLQPEEAPMLNNMKTCDPMYTEDVLKDNDLADSINSIFLDQTNDLAMVIKKDSEFLKN